MKRLVLLTLLLVPSAAPATPLIRARAKSPILMPLHRQFLKAPLFMLAQMSCSTVTQAGVCTPPAAGSLAPGTTTVGSCTDGVLFADAASVLRCNNAELSFIDSIDQLRVGEFTGGGVTAGANGFTTTGIVAGALLSANGGGGEAFLTSDSANILAQRQSTNPQTYRAYGTFTDASNYERASLSHDGTGDAFLSAETAGTGNDNQNVNIVAAGLGGVILSPSPSTGVEVRTGNNAVPIRAYAAFTDPSNYERVSIIPSLGGGVVIAAETAGTGADNLGITLQAVGTGAVNISSGQFLNLVGSATAPSYSFTGDADTGAYRSATNELSLASGGVARVTVTTTTVAYGTGANVASAATIAASGNVFHVTGTTGITSITIRPAGTCITAIFDGILTVTDGSNLILAGSFVTTANDTLSLCSDGTNWYERGRSIN